MVLFFAFGVAAQTTNTLSDAEIQGRALAQKIIRQWPAESSTNHGTLQIRDGKGNRTNLLVEFEIYSSPINWGNLYRTYSAAADTSRWNESLEIIHANNLTNRYWYMEPRGFLGLAVFEVTQTTPFANSDFWLHDLGLEFFHWPTQKVLKKEIHRTCACTVLESTNPNPTTNGYSRVVSWVDTESLGIVEAYAYDFNGKKLKDFYPKDIKKVNGQWQVQTLVMENVQTGSRSRLEFDLKQ
jgi:hypothetical protein